MAGGDDMLVTVAVAGDSSTCWCLTPLRFVLPTELGGFRLASGLLLSSLGTLFGLCSTHLLFVASIHQGTTEVVDDLGWFDLEDPLTVEGRILVEAVRHSDAPCMEVPWVFVPTVGANLLGQLEVGIPDRVEFVKVLVDDRLTRGPHLLDPSVPVELDDGLGEGYETGLDMLSFSLDLSGPGFFDSCLPAGDESV